jgi:hypothetical protein
MLISKLLMVLSHSRLLEDPLDFDAKCDGSLPLESMIKPDPSVRQLLMDIDRSRVRIFALTNAYVNVRGLEKR